MMSRMFPDRLPHEDPANPPGGDAINLDTERLLADLHALYSHAEVPDALRQDGAHAVRLRAATADRAQPGMAIGALRAPGWLGLRLWAWDQLDGLRASPQTSAQGQDGMEKSSALTSAAPEREGGQTEPVGSRSRAAVALGSRPRRAFAAALSMVLVVGLLAGTLVWLHRGRPPVAQPQPVECRNADGLRAQAPGQATVINCDITVHGITLHLDKVYADATRTVVTYHVPMINSRDGQHVVIPARPAWIVLIDSQGQHYLPQLYGGWGLTTGGLIGFPPLPASELGTPQQLIFYAQELHTTDDTPPGCGNPCTVPANSMYGLLNGPWQGRFNVTPLAERTVTLDVAPITHNGLTIQPLELVTAPAGPDLDLDGAPVGGTHILLELSGLPPDASLPELRDFPLNLPSGNERSNGTLTLTLPGGRTLPSNYVAAPGIVVPLSYANLGQIAGEKVGPSGTALLEAIFFPPLPASARTATLTIDNVSIAHIVTNARGQSYPVPPYTLVKGPWVFQVPLR